MVSSNVPAPALAYAQEQNQVRAACPPPPGLAAPAKPPGTFVVAPPPGLNHRAASSPNCTAEMAMFSALKNWTAPVQECWNLENLNGSYEVGKLFHAAMQSPFAEEPPIAMPSACCLADEPRSDVHDLASLCAKERAPILEITKSQSPNGSVIISIPVDSRKLHGKDKQAISQSFELVPGLRCLMMLKPRLPSDRRELHGVDRKGQASFSKSKGKGSIELKMVESDESSAASLGVWCRFSVNEQSTRGPFQLNFAEGIIQGLPKGQDEWNFWSGGDVCVVKLEVLPGSSKELPEVTASAAAAGEQDF